MTSTRSSAWAISRPVDPLLCDAAFNDDGLRDREGEVKFFDVVNMMESPSECIQAVKDEAERRGYELEPAR